MGGAEEAPTEGAPEFSAQEYYSQARPKRGRQTRVSEKKRLRLPRLNPATNSPEMERMEKEEACPVVAPTPECSPMAENKHTQSPVAGNNATTPAPAFVETPTPPAPAPPRRTPRFITHEAINFLTTDVWNNSPAIHTFWKLETPP